MNKMENFWYYEQIGEPKECPKCGVLMPVEFSAMRMMSNPPQQRWYWECGSCGYQELGGVHVHEPVKQRVMI
jgi:ribosomal protein S27AE